MEVTCKPAIVFAPHQDDETFGCGGLIAMKRERGIPVKVVFLTDGAGSHGDIEAHERERLAIIRQEEAYAATAVLGLSREDLLFSGYSDGRLDQITGPQREELVEHLMKILRAFHPGEVYVTHRRDRHGDHEAAYELVIRAVERAGLAVEVFQYAIWAVWWSALGWRLSWRDFAEARGVVIENVSAKKKKAIEIYRSQLAVLPHGFLNRFLWHHEIFFVARARSQSGQR